LVEIALLAFDDFTILYIAWMEIATSACSAPTTKDVVVMWCVNGNLRLLRLLLLGLESGGGGCGGGGYGGDGSGGGSGGGDG